VKNWHMLAKFIVNSIKYRKSDCPPEIKIEIEPEGGNKNNVMDNGIGLERRSINNNLTNSISVQGMKKS
jgi:HSP90 family molecular chaperone